MSFPVHTGEVRVAWVRERPPLTPRCRVRVGKRTTGKKKAIETGGERLPYFKILPRDSCFLRHWVLGVSGILEDSISLKAKEERGRRG